MKNIILDCDLMRHPNSGLYHYCLNLANYASRIFESGDVWEQMKYYSPASEAAAFEKTSHVIKETKWHRYFRPFMNDCALWHAPFQSGRIPSFVHRRIPVLLTIHDLNCLHEGKPEKEVVESLSRTQKLVDRADAIVCISSFTKSDVLKHCHTGNKPLYVIHNGTHHLHGPGLSDQSYKPGSAFYFAMGYVNRKKNFHVLLPLLKNNSLELLIAGRLDEPDYVSLIMQQAASMGVADRLHILGPVSEQEKSWYLNHCEAYLHPSLAEGFGAPVVEAMTYGKPLFLSNLTSLPEIGQEVAFYFSNFEETHMQQVLADGLKTYRQNGLADKIRQRGKEFDWNRKAAEYVQVYRSLL